jgi:hypothetical protein
MPAPSDSAAETALAEPTPQPPRPPYPDGASRPGAPPEDPGPPAAKPADVWRESFLTALLRALAAWPT